MLSPQWVSLDGAVGQITVQDDKQGQCGAAQRQEPALGPALDHQTSTTTSGTASRPPPTSSIPPRAAP
ncbi:MAG: hypothetical protein WDN45_06485 [Caulobacteraceae bacterium]